jgi:TP901 family phage tail tape measure protein
MSLLGAAGGGLAETQLLIARLRLDSTGFAQGVASASRGLAGLNVNMGKVATGVGQLARGGLKVLERGFYLAAGGLLYLTKQALDFEDAFAGVARTLSDNAAPAQLAEIRKGLLQLALQLPITQVELAKIAEVAGTAGIAAEDIVKFTGAIARLSKVTDLSVEEITPSVAKLMKVMGIGTDEINNFFSALSQASIIAPSTDQEMILAAERFAALAAQIGFTRDQVIGLATVATSFGQRPEAAGTAVLLVMQRAVRDIAEGGKKLKLFAQISGETAATVKAQWKKGGDPFGGLLAFLEGFGKLSPGKQALVAKELGFSTARIGQLLANLAKNPSLLQEYVDAITQADVEGTAFLQLSDKRFTTTRNHLILLWNNVKDVAIAFGEGLGIDTATGALDRFIAKVIAFLQAHRADFVTLGRDLGRWLDRVNIGGILNTLTTMLQTAKDTGAALGGLGDSVWSFFSKDPPPNWVLLIGELAALNKLSGGLLGQGITSITSGLLGGITKALITNKLIPQNVIIVGFSPVAMAQMAGAGLAGGGSVAGEVVKVGLIAAVIKRLGGLKGLLGLVGFATGAIVTGDTAPGATDAAMTPQQYLADLLKMQAQGRGGELVDFNGKTVNQAIAELRAQGIIPLAEAAQTAARAISDAGLNFASRVKTALAGTQTPGRRDPLTDPTRPPGKGWSWSLTQHKWVRDKPPATSTEGGLTGTGSWFGSGGLGSAELHGLGSSISQLAHKLPIRIIFRPAIPTVIVNVTSTIGTRSVVRSFVNTGGYGPIYVTGGGLGAGAQ